MWLFSRDWRWALSESLSLCVVDIDTLVHQVLDLLSPPITPARPSRRCWVQSDAAETPGTVAAGLAPADQNSTGFEVKAAGAASACFPRLYQRSRASRDWANCPGAVCAAVLSLCPGMDQSSSA